MSSVKSHNSKIQGWISDSGYLNFLSPQQELIKIGIFLLYYSSNIPINSLIYLSAFKILRKENKIFQDLRISASLADSALWIFEGRKIGYITYLKSYIKIRVNTMDRDYNGRRAFDLSGKAHFSADFVISVESTWPLISGA